jgi:hypothetical protein
MTSKGLCQEERGADALILVFVIEDGEENSIHRGSVGENGHWPGTPSGFGKASFDSVGGSTALRWARDL